MAEITKLALAAVVILSLATPAMADHDAPGAASGAHQHAAAIEIPPGPAAPSVAVAVARDAVGGWNLRIETKNFRFAPEHASLPHIAGEGHAHLYVNGRKAARIYGPWHHIEALPAGQVEIAVSLTANDHRDFSVGGRTVRATTTVKNDGPATPAGHAH
jgi:hypothetical protein